ncbi:N-terminal glutamine amidase-domain-containing protein [Pisolithus tinctorius]|nr:N-terminal glutamine amidase-domain-containing protein [Pisolithus tinctorius]
MLPNFEDNVYTSQYCEENIYHLAQRMLAQPDSDSRWDINIIFVSNLSRTVALWNQRISSSRDTAVIWDYHVVLTLRGAFAVNRDDEQETWIYDLDTRLPVPCPWEGTYKLDCETLHRLLAWAQPGSYLLYRIRGANFPRPRGLARTIPKSLLWRKICTFIFRGRTATPPRPFGRVVTCRGRTTALPRPLNRVVTFRNHATALIRPRHYFSRSRNRTTAPFQPRRYLPQPHHRALSAASLPSATTPLDRMSLYIYYIYI